METLKQSLPATFRITGTTNKYAHACAVQVLYLDFINSDAYCLKQCLQERFFTELHKIEVDGERVPMPQPIPWYVTPCNVRYIDGYVRYMVVTVTLCLYISAFGCC